MGLPKVADFARNFAVMVRVQGPDPNGLKMRNHAFHHYNSGKTMLSVSGMIFPTPNGSGCSLKSSETVLVLIVPSVIEPFVIQQNRESKVEKRSQLISGVQIDVLMEGESMTGGHMDALPWISAELVKFEVGWSLATHLVVLTILLTVLVPK